MLWQFNYGKISFIVLVPDHHYPEYNDNSRQEEDYYYNNEIAERQAGAIGDGTAVRPVKSSVVITLMPRSD